MEMKPVNMELAKFRGVHSPARLPGGPHERCSIGASELVFEARKSIACTWTGESTTAVAESRTSASIVKTDPGHTKRKAGQQLAHREFI